MATRQFVLVQVAAHRRLIRLDEIRSVVAMMELHEVEGRAGACRGLINLRGEVIPVFDLGGADRAMPPSRVIVVVEHGRTLAGLVVDDIVNVIDVPAGDIATRHVGGARPIEVARLDHDLVPVVDASHETGNGT